MIHIVFGLMAAGNRIIWLGRCSFCELILRKSAILLVINGLIAYRLELFSAKLWSRVYITLSINYLYFYI
jgi:hypothetical protein